MTPDVAAWRARNPRAFGPPVGQRVLLWAGAALFLAWLAWVFWLFDITPARIWNGLGGLAPSWC